MYIWKRMTSSYKICAGKAHSVRGGRTSIYYNGDGKVTDM